MDYSSKFLKVVRVREVPSSNLGTPTSIKTPNPRESFVCRSRFPIEGLCKSRHPDLSRLRIRGLETADLKTLIREVRRELTKKQTVDLSAPRHIYWVERPFQRVLSCGPSMYDELWIGAKAMYKLEPAVAIGGEVIIYAPYGVG